MSDYMSENDALSKLGINDFSEVSNNNFTEFVSIYNKLDRECQLKAIEAIPALIGIAKETINVYKEVLDKSLSNNSSSINNYYAVCHKIIDSCSTTLEDENLTFEKKKEVIDQMVFIQLCMAYR